MGDTVEEKLATAIEGLKNLRGWVEDLKAEAKIDHDILIKLEASVKTLAARLSALESAKEALENERKATLKRIIVALLSLLAAGGAGAGVLKVIQAIFGGG